VTDPTHPLFGRRFRVLTLSHPPQRPGHVLVAYQDGMRLRIPVLATNLVPRPLTTRCKLTPDALRHLLALVQECQRSCPDHPNGSGADSLTT
jgi:hypothetical protein